MLYMLHFFNGFDDEADLHKYVIAKRGMNEELKLAPGTPFCLVHVSFITFEEINS